MNEGARHAGVQVTREALVDGARACVRDHGIANATSRRIAGAAGANLGAITYYFGSKDALLAEALFGELERRLTPVLALLEGDGPPVNRLLEAVRYLTDEFQRSAAEVPVFLDALVLSTGASPWAERGRQLIAGLHRRLSAVIAELTEGAALAPWIDPGAMASLLIATANGIALQSRLQPDDDSLVMAMAGQLVGLLLGAAAPGSGGVGPDRAIPAQDPAAQ